VCVKNAGKYAEQLLSPLFSLDALGYATKIYSTLMRNAGGESEMNVCDIERDG